LQRTGQCRLGRGICGSLGAEGRGSHKDTHDDAEGSEAGMSVQRCVHSPILPDATQARRALSAERLPFSSRVAGFGLSRPTPTQRQLCDHQARR
jgi:hypothetical protein